MGSTGQTLFSSRVTRVLAGLVEGSKRERTKITELPKNKNRRKEQKETHVLGSGRCVLFL